MDNIQLTNDNIGDILTRFFDGDTTCAEEKALEEYFRGTSVPARYECYRDMFGWYASGMKEEELPKPAQLRRRTWRRILGWSSVAAVVALALSALPLRRAATMSEQPLLEGSFVVHNGRTITGTDEIRSEIEATLLDGDCLDREIDMRMSMLSSELCFE